MAVLAMMKEGVCWRDCHIAAEKQIIKQLIRIGIIIGGNVNDNEFIDKLVKQRLGAVFLPHGMGHLIGLDTHDVGGYVFARAVHILMYYVYVRCVVI